jgi:outer membrane protein
MDFKNRKIVVLIGLILVFSSGYGQMSSFTLEQCIQRALDYNLSVILGRNNSRIEQLNKQESLLSLLPTLNSAHGGRFDYGRSSDDSYNVTFDPKYSTQHSVTASVVLFRGFSKLQNIKAAGYFYLAGKDAEDLVRRRIAFEVMHAWYELHLQQALVVAAREQMKTAETQFNMTSERVKVGLLEESALIDAEAAVSYAAVNVQSAENRYRTSELNMKQLLEIGYSEPFMAVDTFNEIPVRTATSIDSVYQQAEAYFPRIKQIENELRGLQRLYKAQLGLLAPSITAQSGLYSSYFKRDMAAADPFRKQLDEKLNSYVSVQLNIPIFNGLNRQYDIKRQRIAVDNKKIEMEAAKREIVKQIEQAILELESEFSQYSASVQNERALHKALELQQERFNLGLCSVSELMLTDDRYRQARIAVVSSQYQWLVLRKTIDFYAGRTF